MSWRAGSGRAESAQGELGANVNDGEEVPEVMGNSARQAPHRLHLLQLPELLLEPLALADIRAHSRKPYHLSLAVSQRDTAELVGNRRAVLADEPRLALPVSPAGRRPDGFRNGGAIIFIEHLRHRSPPQLVRPELGDVLEPPVPTLQNSAIVERVQDVGDALHDVFAICQRAGHGLMRKLQLPRVRLQVFALARLALAPLRLGSPPALVERVDEGGGQGEGCCAQGLPDSARKIPDRRQERVVENRYAQPRGEQPRSQVAVEGRQGDRREEGCYGHALERRGCPREPPGQDHGHHCHAVAAPGRSGIVREELRTRGALSG